MAEQYVHTLISIPKDFVPTPDQAQGFVSALLSLGAVPSPSQLRLITPTDQFRTFVNPFTQQPMSRRVFRNEELSSVSQVASQVAGLADYELEVAGAGRPALPPLPIDFADPYHVAVRLRVSSVLCSTSAGDDELPGYGKPCEDSRPVGIFINPHSGELIEVPGAGCARFWIELELGKFLFPEIADNDLAILNPAITAAAETHFGVPFVQGLGPSG